MPLNAQQQAALDFCLDPNAGSLSVIARAGSGKTYFLITAASQVPGRVFVGAFNRSIADELQRRLPQRYGLEANTLHGAGLRAWRAHFHNTKVDGQKIRQIARKTWAIDKKVADAADLLVGYAKQAGLGLRGAGAYEDVDLWEQLIDYYDCEEEIPTSIKRRVFLEGCAWTYETSLEWCQGRGTANGESVLDFNDMLFAPLYFRLPMRPVDWVLLDEAQDTNETRRRLCAAMLGQGRMVAVGDPAQSIYGFAGASDDAMGIIQRELGAAELPLNVTYRCPRAVVELARTWVPDFTAHESVQDGIVRHISHEDFWLERFDPRTDVILCRYTRPLAGIAARLRDRGMPCVVEGQSGKNLIALVNKWGEINLEQFLTLLAEYERQKADEWAAADRPDKEAAVRDRCGTVRAFIRGMSLRLTTRDLARQIEITFRDEDRAGALVLATVHRSKGREWERVYLIGRNKYMPSAWARREWECEQERNLMYVGVTRAKQELVEVDVPEGEDDWWERD